MQQRHKQELEAHGIHMEDNVNFNIDVNVDDGSGPIEQLFRT